MVRNTVQVFMTPVQETLSKSKIKRKLTLFLTSLIPGSDVVKLSWLQFTCWCSKLKRLFNWLIIIYLVTLTALIFNCHWLQLQIKNFCKNIFKKVFWILNLTPVNTKLKCLFNDLLLFIYIKNCKIFGKSQISWSVWQTHFWQQNVNFDIFIRPTHSLLYQMIPKCETNFTLNWYQIKNIYKTKHKALTLF
jgi:hypothetical protein